MGDYFFQIHCLDLFDELTTKKKALKFLVERVFLEDSYKEELDIFDTCYLAENWIKAHFPGEAYNWVENNTKNTG